MKRKFAIIALVVVVCFLNFLGIVFTLVKYPQVEIDLQELYGENYGNINGFSVDRDGNLISLSEDPWILYQLETPTNIKNVCVEIASVSDDGEWSQIFFTETWDTVVTYLEKGRNVYTFGRNQNTNNISVIRLDLACHTDVVLKVDKVILNDRISPAENIALIGLHCFLFLLMLEVFLLLDVRRSRGRIWTLCGFVIFGLQGAMIYSIFIQFKSNTLSDPMWNWCRIFFLCGSCGLLSGIISGRTGAAKRKECYVWDSDVGVGGSSVRGNGDPV